MSQGVQNPVKTPSSAPFPFTTAKFKKTPPTIRVLHLARTLAPLNPSSINGLLHSSLVYPRCIPPPSPAQKCPLNSTKPGPKPSPRKTTKPIWPQWPGAGQRRPHSRISRSPAPSPPCLAPRRWRRHRPDVRLQSPVQFSSPTTSQAFTDINACPTSQTGPQAALAPLISHSSRWLQRLEVA